MHAAFIAIISLVLWSAVSQAEPLRTDLVERSGVGGAYPAEGVVEAVRQTVLAAQVQGKITALYVKAGDRVSAGQVLVRIDARAASKTAAASAATVKAAEARLFAAQKEYERVALLAEKHYISQAALERADAQFKAIQAEVEAQLALAAAADVSTSLYTLTAPYAARVSSVDVALGDMAMPGRPLISLFDPTALRVTVNVPQKGFADIRLNGGEKIEIPALPEATRWLKPRAVTVLPTADEVSHTVRLRLDFGAPPAGVMPGMFARAWLTNSAAAGSRLSVPVSAVFRRTELTAVYVVDGGGKVTLRQVRVGEAGQDRIEILAGVSEGERVALDPIAAAAVSR